MNAQDYIASGLLEAYVAGALSTEEQRDVEAAIGQYHEVAAEVTAIEETMWKLAEKQAIAPPPMVQEQIWDAIQRADGNARKSGRVMAFGGAPVARKVSFAQAATVAALVGSLALNYIFWNRSNEANKDVVAMRQQMDTLRTNNTLMASNMSRYQQEMEMMADTNMKPILMQTAQKGHPMAATVYWSKNKSEAYLAINKLPPAPEGKQYQLWVIADGKPVDLGVIAENTVSAQGMYKVPKTVSGGQAFAISLEKKGGSQTPDMEQIFVMGKV